MKITRIGIIISSVTAGVLTLGVFFFISPGENTNEPAPLERASAAESSGTTSASVKVQETSQKQEELREYRNTARGFSLQYPKELSVKEHDEGDGTYTIVFEDVTGEKGLQVFFTPYLGDAITRSRILKDVPSGKFTEPVEIVIGGGTRALAFFSTGPFGEMREVWFISDGFLYEVTAYKSLDEWLVGIMQTWRFFKN